jgi:hypothetical protein
MHPSAARPPPSTRAPSSSCTAPHPGLHTPEHTTPPSKGTCFTQLWPPLLRKDVTQGNQAQPLKSPSPMSRQQDTRGCVGSQDGHPNVGDNTVRGIITAFEVQHVVSIALVHKYSQGGTRNAEQKKPTNPDHTCNMLVHHFKQRLK